METLSKEQLSIVSEVSLSYRPKVKPSQRPKVMSSQDVYGILSDFWDADKIELTEQFCVMLLNRSNKVLGIVELSSGGVGATVVDIKIVFCVALKACASSIVVAHNHPSGDLKPSYQDVQMTKKLVAAGQVLEIPVQDHLIISSEGYVSLVDEGYMYHLFPRYCYL